MLRPTYPLLTERLSLRPFRDDDLDAFHAIQGRPDVVRYLYWEPRSRDETREMLGRRIIQTAIEREGEGVHLAADLRTCGRREAWLGTSVCSLRARSTTRAKSGS